MVTAGWDGLRRPGGALARLRDLVATPAMAAVLALAGVSPARAAIDEPTCRAALYPQDGRRDAPLYRMSRSEVAAGGGADVRWVYEDAAGQTVAEERIRYRDGRFTRYEMTLPPVDEHAEVRVDGGRLLFSFESDGEVSEDEERFVPSVTVNDELVSLLHARWAELVAGDPVELRMVVPSRTETIAFRFQKVEELSYDGTRAIVVEMRPASLLISLVVSPFHFTLERDGAHRLLEFAGRTTPKVEVDGEWRDLDGVVVYQNCFADRRP